MSARYEIRTVLDGHAIIFRNGTALQNAAAALAYWEQRARGCTIYEGRRGRYAVVDAAMAPAFLAAGWCQTSPEEVPTDS